MNVRLVAWGVMPLCWVSNSVARILYDPFWVFRDREERSTKYLTIDDRGQGQGEARSQGQGNAKYL